MINTLAERIMLDIHGKNVFAGFDHRAHVLDLNGWFSQSPAFAEVIREVRPRLIIEIGSWKGASAIHMCEIMRAEGIAGGVVCIDHWLNLPNIWWDKEDTRRQKPDPDRPDEPLFLYDQFRANVLYNDLQDYIVPIPSTSSHAATWFRRNKVTADVIYLDVGGDGDDTYLDLKNYWPLLAPGGLIFGGCWSTWNSGVVAGVTKFADEVGIAIETRSEHKWVLRKAIFSSEKGDVPSATSRANGSNVQLLIDAANEELRLKNAEIERLAAAAGERLSLVEMLDRVARERLDEIEKLKRRIAELERVNKPLG